MNSSQGPSPGNPFVEFPLADIEQTIARRFEQQVRRYPKRLAVKVGKQSLSYEELNAAANSVARTLLQRAGLKTDPIGILCDTGVSMIVAILGALKASKPFAPLNPRLPKI